MMVYRAIKEQICLEKKNYFVWILMFVYTFLCGTNLDMAEDAGLSAGEFVLLSITDHYYLIYGFFFYGIFWMFKNVKEDSKLELIRYGGYNIYYSVRCVSAFIKFFIFILIHILISTVLGMTKLERTNEFSGHQIANYYNSSLEFTLEFQKFFNNPIIAILAVVSFLTLGMFFIYEIFFYIHKIKGNTAEILAVIIIIVNVMIGFKSQVDESFLEVFFINNYFILHHSLFLVGKSAVWFNVISMIILSILMNRLTVKIKCRGKIKNKREEKYISSMICGRKSIMIAFILSLLFLKIVQIFIEKYNAKDYLLSCIQGFSINEINIINILYYMAYFIYPMFIIMCFFEREKQEGNLLAKVRFGNRNNWDSQVRRNCVRFLYEYSVLYWGSQFGIAVVLNFIFGKRSSKFMSEFIQFYNLQENRLFLLILLCVLLHVIELFILYEISLCLRKYFNSTIYIFLGTFFGYIITVIAGIDSIWNPFGGSSLYSVVERKEEQLIYTIIVNLGWIVILSFIQSNLFERCILYIVERIKSIVRKGNGMDYGNYN